MPRYKLTIAYDGSGFHGWQEQKPVDGAPAVRTVQAAVRDAIQHVARQPISLRGASRTDTGVHALGQVAHFDAAGLTVPLDRLPDAINSRLTADVDVRAAEVVADDFDATSHAREKQYRYRIWNSDRRPLWLRHAVHHCWHDLDAGPMHQAAQRLVGQHDFAAFTNAGHGRLSTVRSIFDCRVDRPGDLSPELHIVVRGDGFLYNMIRIIAGTLIEVGRTRKTVDWIDALLEHGDRHQSGPTAPPEGLCLEWVRY